MAQPGAKTSKTNRSSRNIVEQKRFYQGKEVIPTLYVGTFVGHGRYFAAAYVENGKFAMDSAGKPLPWDATNNPEAK